MLQELETRKEGNSYIDQKKGGGLIIYTLIKKMGAIHLSGGLFRAAHAYYTIIGS